MTDATTVEDDPARRRGVFPAVPTRFSLDGSLDEAERREALERARALGLLAPRSASRGAREETRP